MRSVREIQTGGNPMIPSDIAGCVSHECTMRLTCLRYAKAQAMKRNEVGQFVYVRIDQRNETCPEYVPKEEK